MSNAKWRKLFRVINSQSLKLNGCTWKLVDQTEPETGFLPDHRQLGETYVGDCGALNGPFEFRAIEWISIPAKQGYRPYENAPLSYIHQNLNEVKKKIDSAGRYEYEITEEDIKIYGYKP
ncbi:MAG: hypothetical protein NPINA01_10160 [Nitrospinaceae bacterium]|nr:MAG: hypothetical protein NPINA01_10160 [Nitrospinaceae bacterium]